MEMRRITTTNGAPAVRVVFLEAPFVMSCGFLAGRVVRGQINCFDAGTARLPFSFPAVRCTSRVLLVN